MKTIIFSILIQLVLCAMVTAQQKSPESILNNKKVKQAASIAKVDISRHMVCWKGATPQFDGIIDTKEYADASYFDFVKSEYDEAMDVGVTSPQDLNFHGWIKHDGEYLYMAFDIKDDIFYGIETDRWTPAQDPNTHVVGSREEGRPWFGDMIEVLFYSRLMDTQQPVLRESQSGDGRLTQIVYNLTKSHEAGIGVAGFLPHGPGRSQENWENNTRWIRDGIVDSKTAIYPEENRYTVELKFRLNGAIELEKGKYWSVDKPDAPVAFNFTVGDVDQESKSPTGRLYHEVWWAPKYIELPNDAEPIHKGWGILIMTSKSKLL